MLPSLVVEGAETEPVPQVVRSSLGAVEYVMLLQVPSRGAARCHATEPIADVDGVFRGAPPVLNDVPGVNKFLDESQKADPGGSHEASHEKHARGDE